MKEQTTKHTTYKKLRENYQEPTTATRNAAFKFPQASQQARVVRKGNHMRTTDRARKRTGVIA